MIERDFDELAAILEFDHGYPRDWAEALARLSTAQKPDMWATESWDETIADGYRLVARHLPKLLRNGWRPTDVRQLIPVINGREVVAVGFGDVTVRSFGGNTEKIFYRPVAGGGVPNWEEGRRSA